MKSCCAKTSHRLAPVMPGIGIGGLQHEINEMRAMCLALGAYRPSESGFR
jgi:hypothetical protein